MWFYVEGYLVTHRIWPRATVYTFSDISVAVKCVVVVVKQIPLQDIWYSNVWCPIFFIVKDVWCPIKVQCPIFLVPGPKYFLHLMSGVVVVVIHIAMRICSWYFIGRNVRYFRYVVSSIFDTRCQRWCSFYI